MVDTIAKDWSLEFANLKKAECGWSKEASFRRAKQLAPETFAPCANSSMRRREHAGGEGPKRGCRPNQVPSAVLTILGELAEEVCSQVPLSCVHLQGLFHAKLQSLHINWNPTLEWTRLFLREGGGLFIQEAREGPAQGSPRRSAREMAAQSPFEACVDGAHLRSA